MGLNVGMIRAEELTGSVPGDIFHNVYALAAAVIPLAGVALGIFVGQHSAHRGHHRRADDVFRGNQLDIAALAVVFLFNRGAHLWVELLYQVHILSIHGLFPPVHFLPGFGFCFYYILELLSFQWFDIMVLVFCKNIQKNGR